MSLKDELEIIDETRAELEGRRIEIINRMEAVKGELGSGRDDNVLVFPEPSVQVRCYSKNRHPW